MEISGLASVVDKVMKLEPIVVLVSGFCMACFLKMYNTTRSFLRRRRIRNKREMLRSILISDPRDL